MGVCITNPNHGDSIIKLCLALGEDDEIFWELEEKVGRIIRGNVVANENQQGGLHMIPPSHDGLGE